MSNDSEVKAEAPAPEAAPAKPVLVPTEQQQRSERVRRADVAAITSRTNAKSFATNQGVDGHVRAELSKSEQAIAIAMTEVFKKFNEQTSELTQKVDALQHAFDQVSTIHQSQHVQAFGRISALEMRWWERLMRDVEWDLYTLRDWVMGLFGWVPQDLEVEVDSGVVDIAPYLPKTHTDESIADATNPVADPAVVAALQFPNSAIEPKDDAVFAEEGAEWLICCCGHMADQHTFTHTAGCLVEGCGCKDFIAVGSTMKPELVTLRD